MPVTLPKSVLIGLVGFFAFALSAIAQAPAPILLTPDRLDRIQAGLADPDSHYAQAFAQLRARVDSRDLDLFNRTATNWNYARSYYAQAAAFVFRVTGDPVYAQWAFEALYDVHNDIDPDGRLPESGAPTDSAGLSRATVGLGFGLAYNWAYEAWTAEQRDYIRNRVHVALNMWLSYTHPNITHASRGSNWVAVCRGGELMMILGIGEQTTRSSRVNTLLGDLRTHLQNGHDVIGGTQEGVGYAGYGGIFLLPAIYASRDAGFNLLWDFVRNTPREWHKKAMYSGTFSLIPGTTTLADRRMWQASGVGGPNTNDEGWASLILESVPAADRPYFLWWYDRHLGRLAEPADRPDLRFDHSRQGTMWALLFYPDDVTPADPTGQLPFVVTGDQGRHYMRARWRDTQDISVSIHADLRHHPNAWAQSEAGQTGLIAYGTMFFSGPRTSREPRHYTRMLINGQRGNDPDPGRRQHLATFESGAYVVVDGHTQYANMGAALYERHLLTDFGHPDDNNAVIAMFDRVASYSQSQYTWNANVGSHAADFGIVSSIGEDQGFPTFTLVSPNGGTVKGWVLSPAGAVLNHVPGERLTIDKTGYTEDFFVVMSVEPETTPPLEVLSHGNGGTIVRLGDKTVALDRTSGTLLRGGDAESLDLDHAAPLPVLGLSARPLSDQTIALNWLPAASGATSFVIEKRGPGESGFTPVATVGGSASSHNLVGLSPQSSYTLRVVALANGMSSAPSNEVEAATFETGLAVYVEDFAPRMNGQLPAVNAIADWQIVNQDRGWVLRATEGSPRNAANPIGEMATAGRTRINFQNIFFTDEIRADLSTPSAAVEVDIQTEGTIRFSLLLKLASGQWVRTSAEAHIASRTSWHRQRWSIPSISAWNLYDVSTLATGASTTLSAADLADIRGIGIRAQWPLNERWARLDQLHLYAKDFVGPQLPLEGFAAWRATAFGDDADNEAIAGFAATPARDGIANGLKYAMGWPDPLAPAAHLLPVAVSHPSGMVLTYTWDSRVDDVDLIPEVSTDLETWHSGAAHVEEVDREINGHLHHITVRPLHPSSNAFLRLRAEAR